MNEVEDMFVELGPAENASLLETRDGDPQQLAHALVLAGKWI